MNDIDTYLSLVEPAFKPELQKIRSTIKKIIPDVTETISYGMPVFKYKGTYLIGYAGFKNHMSLFPGSEAIEELKNDLKGFKTSKGTIQFTIDNPITEEMLNRIVMICKNRIENNH